MHTHRQDEHLALYDMWQGAGGREWGREAGEEGGEGMKTNYYAEAIDIITNHLRLSNEIVIQAAKTNPSVIVKAYRTVINMEKGYDTVPPYAWHDEVLSVLNAGRKIEAIKLCREKMGWGLKEAKDYVDRMG